MVLHSLLFEQDPIELNNLHGCRIMVLVGCIELKPYPSRSLMSK